MELVFVKRGEGIIQVGTESYPAQYPVFIISDADGIGFQSLEEEES